MCRYSLASSWPSLVPLALGFLAGELTYSQELEQSQEREQELVPYLENKGSGVYAWIGAGRDSDSRLLDLCTKFLMHRYLNTFSYKSIYYFFMFLSVCAHFFSFIRDSLGPSYISSAVVSVKQISQLSTPSNTNNNGNSTTNGNTRSGSPAVESINIDTSSLGSITEWEPPRALWPTEWKVRPSTIEEREEFRRQERMRYAAPHKAFTYRMHGYASVVGPVKGIYQHNVGAFSISN